MAARSASRQAGFLLPYLRTGLRVLDCGCGPGTITVGLAEIVAPGQVEGIDLDPGQIDRARAHALERGVSNVSFQPATLYELPFPADSFDVVFANTVIQHLREPLRALREIRRVLVPGGVVGLRDEDSGATLIEPFRPDVQLWQALYLKVWTFNGGDPFIGRKHRRLLNEAGFVQTRTSSSAEAHDSAEVASILVEHHRAPTFSSVVLEQGWSTSSELEAMYDGVLDWGNRDDTFLSLTYREAIGAKPQPVR